MLRFLMIFGVVVVHTPPTASVYEMDGTVWPYITSFFQNGVFKAGVPVLTMISGFLLFFSNGDQKYFELLKKKAASLLIPFMVFNFGHIALQLVLRLTTGRWLGEDLFSQNLDGWMNSLFSLRGVPENDPLHFLRELIVLLVLAPIFGLLIRRIPVIGLMTVSIFFLSNTDGYLINRSDMPIEFYIGGLAAVYKWNLEVLDKFSYVSLTLFLGACAVVSLFQIGSITWLRLISPLLVWSAASLLVNKKIGSWMASLSIYSFFIYLTHAPLMRMIWILCKERMSTHNIAIFTVVAPFVVTILCIYIHKNARAFAPKLFDWATGAREQSKKYQLESYVVNQPERISQLQVLTQNSSKENDSLADSVSESIVSGSYSESPNLVDNMVTVSDAKLI